MRPLTPQQEEALRVMRARDPRPSTAMDIFFAADSTILRSARGMASVLSALRRAGLVERRAEWVHSWKGGRPSNLRDSRENHWYLTEAGRR